MLQARVMVCPSRYDEAPNVLFEAAIAGCNLVCSGNCGNYRLADSDLVARLELPDFGEKIKTALQGYRPANTSYFEKHDLSQWVVKQLGRGTNHVAGVSGSGRVKDGEGQPLAHRR